MKIDRKAKILYVKRWEFYVASNYLKYCAPNPREWRVIVDKNEKKSEFNKK